MEEYEVYFYFNVLEVKPFARPSTRTVVKIKKGSTETQIIRKGLKQIVEYPKTYTATIKKL